MTNPYMFGSDYDSMAGIAPQKAAILQQRGVLAHAALAAALAGAPGANYNAALQRGTLAFQRPSPMVRPVGPVAAPYQGFMAPQYNPQAEAFELARGNEALFGMDSGAALLAPGTGGTVFTGPQKPCIPTRLVLSDNMANNFTMSNLSVGVEPILLTNGTNINLACFTPQSTASPFRSVLCHVGNTISAAITNFGGANARFIATIYAVPWLYGPAYN